MFQSPADYFLEYVSKRGGKTPIGNFIKKKLQTFKIVTRQNNLPLTFINAQ